MASSICTSQLTARKPQGRPGGGAASACPLAGEGKVGGGGTELRVESLLVERGSF